MKILLLLFLALPVFGQIIGGGSGSVSNEAYDATTWNGKNSVAPSKNAVRDKIEALIISGGDGTANFTGAGNGTNSALVGILTVHQLVSSNGVVTSVLSVNDDAYDATTWNASTNVPTKNAVRDQLEILLALIPTSPSDTAFASSWNGVTTIAPSKNAIYDWAHLFDTDDDGKPDVIDVVSTAGFMAVTSGGVPVEGRTLTEGLAIDITNPTGAAGDPVLSFDPTEFIGNRTFGDGSDASIVWTFNLSGTDPTLTISSGKAAWSGFALPNAAGSSTLAAAGDVAVNTTGKVMGVHNGTKEVAVPLVYSKEFSFDPKAVCDGAVDRLFLFTVGAWAPNGITITRWRLSFEADPTTEVDLDLKRADAFIGVANSAVMDVLDTTAGASTETTAANINAGAVVATGKAIYLEFGTAYSETTHQMIFEIEFELEED